MAMKNVGCVQFPASLLKVAGDIVTSSILPSFSLDITQLFENLNSNEL
jgi:hypothetical protein